LKVERVLTLMNPTIIYLKYLNFPEVAVHVYTFVCVNGDSCSYHGCLFIL